jgi:hypothetical protein
MSVSSTDNQIIYTGSGTTGPFDFDFRIFETSDLLVQKLTIATEAIVTLTETTDYSVTLDEDGTGSVTTVAIVTSSYKLIITRTLPLTQEVTYVEYDKFPSTSHEEALDRSRMIDQQLQEQISRCIIANPGTDVPTIADLNAAVTAAELAETNAEAAEVAAELAQAAAEAAAATLTFASKAEAEAGTINTKGMTPLRTAEAIAAQVLSPIKGDGTVNPTNLLSNGDFESWSAGAAAAPDGWTLSGAGASVAKNTTAAYLKIGTASVTVTRAGTDCFLYLETHKSSLNNIGYIKGRVLTLGCWVYASVAGRARIGIVDSVGATYSSYHTGDSTFQWLTVTRTIDASATGVSSYLQVDTGNTTAAFDGAICVEGSSAFAFSPKPAEEGVWADYSAVSTIVGWASFTAKQIYTKKIGKTVFVTFYVGGTSDANSVSFSLPYVSHATLGTFQGPNALVQDNSVNLTTPGRVLMAANGNAVIVYKDCGGSNVFTTSGGKVVAGQFSYESA